MAQRACAVCVHQHHPQVEECLRESGIREGLVLVDAQHITANVFINDDESSLHADCRKWLEELAPPAPTDQYQHNHTGEACPEGIEGTTPTPT